MKISAVLFAVVLGLSAASECDFVNTDVWYGDIENFYATSLEDCKDQCRKDIACTAIVYYYWGLMTGKCFKKNSGHGTAISCAWCITSYKPCMVDELACSAGQSRASGACADCPENTFSAKGGDCADCPDNTASQAGSASCTDVQVQCGKGSSLVAGACQPCPANSYNDVAGGACKPCGGGKTSPAGSTSASACVAVPVKDCWVMYPKKRLTGSYGKAGAYKKQEAACKADDKCTGVTCKRKKGKEDSCNLNSGSNATNANKKYYIYKREC